jgi:5'-nucleotidase
MQQRLLVRWFAAVGMLMALVLMPMPAAAQEGGDFTLTVIHTNDTHSHIEQFNASGSTCSDEEAAANECFGGVARRATKIAELRGAATNPILVDAGDQFQGSLFYTQYKGAEAVEFMTTLGYEAMTIGNHEFDDGPENLGNFLDNVSFPVVSANIDASAEPAIDGKFVKSTIIEVGGDKVGILGLTTNTTPYTSSPGPTVAFGDYAPALEPEIAALQEQGVNKIVLLSHIGYEDDQTLAAAIDGIDVIVGGHSHTLLSNTAEEASGPYPTVVDSPSGAPVLIVQDGAYGKYLGNLEVSFDADGVATSWQGDPILLDSTVAEDPDVLARVEEMAVPLEALRTTVIGETATDLDGSRTTCRFAECSMGALITDAMVWASQNDGVQIGIENGGGIRSSIEAGEVTMGQVIEVLPFGNTLATFGLTGEDLLAALENGVSRAENPDNEGTGRFPQVSGMRFTWDGTQPVGQRIVSAELENADGAFIPIDPTATYKIATNDFNRRGGDEYTVFAEKAIDPYDFGPPLDQVVADYIKEYTPINVQLEGRITRVDSPVTQEPAEASAETAAVTATETTTTAATAASTASATPEATASETATEAAPTEAATPEATVSETATAATEAAATEAATPETTPTAMPTTGADANTLPLITAFLVVVLLAGVEAARGRRNRVM